ncbi:MAG: hypothetical protein CVT48_06425 [Thermoplasmata archaeon HGW-Thermoplasmata-1]|nr:hypothetical protein [Candidatus Methanoperedens sp.]PKK85228.1 MAG: hypothetical protein CVT48_06425 [Thermoplasmata archaeon HGW-Thermoplasmata-1]
MAKIAYLSPQEQFMFNAMRSGEIVDAEELPDTFPEIKSARINKILSSLSSKGYIYRLKKGKYLVQAEASDGVVVEDPYKTALAIFSGYIGFSSALRVYDMLDYEPFTVFVVTNGRSGIRKIGQYEFRAVAMGKRASGMTNRNGLYVSTVAKTFFDCFYRPQYGGGYSAITKGLAEAKIDWDEFISYFDSESGSLCQRTGYVLEMMKVTGTVPDSALEYFRKRVKNNTRLLPSGKASGKYSSKWKVMDNLGEKNIMSWWHHG